MRKGNNITFSLARKVKQFIDLMMLMHFREVMMNHNKRNTSIRILTWRILIKSEMLLGRKLMIIKDGEHGLNKAMNTESMKVSTKTMARAHKEMIMSSWKCLRACKPNKMSAMKSIWDGAQTFRKIKMSGTEICKKLGLSGCTNSGHPE